ncbi:MAG TPA: hypothetical protein VMR52_06710 [Dehalococcoidia bacterium]|nr:hypothetical protein [Dehalococcoidia bacterium]
MSTLHFNLGSFVMASIVVLVLSYGLLQAGAFGEQASSIAYAPGQAPAVLEATATPAPQVP